ncbi:MULTISPECIES: hypothetical protein [Arthrobacter]|uniref:hypothetical protein n=1 Tax=Arthrobacter TaxID=1663 RepID=UPI0006DA9E07|nr:hypothetical protein [Arthrobacter sp. Edens01]KPN19228.1 hypothetical protein AO716_05310 [Arthrobacter sp. Edens01]
MNSEKDARTGLLRPVTEWLGASPVLPRIATGLLLAGVLAVFPGFMMFLFVAGGKFIPWWMAGGVLLAAAAALVLIQASARKSVPEDHAFKWSEVQNSWFWTSLVLCAFCCGIGMAVDAWDRSGYSVVSRNNSGCTLIAKETTYFRGGGGVMYLAEPWGLAHRVGDWSVNEGGRPARDGLVKVSWAGSGVTYSVDGAPYGPYGGVGKGRCWTKAVTDRLGGD